MDESTHNRNPDSSETGEYSHAPLEGFAQDWPSLSHKVRMFAAKVAWLLLADHDYSDPDEAPDVQVLALAWQDRACRGWLQAQQETWARDRRADFATRLEALAGEPTADDTRGMPLAAFKGMPVPAPVLWRDDNRRLDAVLSRGEVAILSGAGGLGKSYPDLGACDGGRAGCGPGERPRRSMRLARGGWPRGAGVLRRQRPTLVRPPRTHGANGGGRWHPHVHPRHVAMGS